MEIQRGSTLVKTELSEEELNKLLDSRKNNGQPKKINVGKRYLKLQKEVLIIRDNFYQFCQLDQNMVLSNEFVDKVNNIKNKIKEYNSSEKLELHKLYDNYFNRKSKASETANEFIKAYDEYQIKKSKVSQKYFTLTTELTDQLGSFKKLVLEDYFDLFLLITKKP